MIQIHKYPRTHHIQGSRLQPGDEDLNSIPFAEIAGKYLVVEEKMDGANSGISFSESGELQLQSRGHYLTGGAREKHYDLFKSWAYTYTGQLWEVLGSRYVMYGEWLYAKHTVFYDLLPHYFMEFDILDTQTRQFLSTSRRKQMLENCPFIHPVKVLSEGPMHHYEELLNCLGNSFFISDQHLENLRQAAENRNLRSEQVLFETDPSRLMEGLYIKVEEEGEVKARYKYVRADFLTTVLNSQSHWLNRPIVPNHLHPDAKIFEGEG